MSDQNRVPVLDFSTDGKYPADRTYYIENYTIAAKLLELVLKRFELQQATIVDVKLAQQSFENAAYLVINLKYANKAAEVELKKIASKLVF